MALNMKHPFVRAALEAHQTVQLSPKKQPFNPTAAELNTLDVELTKLIVAKTFTVANIDQAINNLWQSAQTCPQNNYLQGTAWHRAFELHQIPEQYAHVRDALMVFAIQDATWAPTAAEVTAMVARLHTNPLAATITAAELDPLVALGNTTTAATRTVTDMVNAANGANAEQQAAVAAAIAVANTTQARIQHLQAIPEQYAHVRDALMVFAVQDATWAPTAAEVIAMVTRLHTNPLAATITEAELDQLVALGHTTAATRTVTDMVNGANAAQQTAVVAAITAASAAQRRIASIKTEINKFSASPAEAHPELMNLIGRLPSDKQQSLVDNNFEKLQTLLSAKSQHDVFVAARTCGFDSSYFLPASTKPGGHHPLEGLWDEIQGTRRHLKLHNSKIAEVLAEKSIVLDNASITKWNEIILNKETDPTKNCDAGHFDTFAQALANEAKINKQPLISSQKAALINALIAAQGDIINQHTRRNVNIITKLNAAVSPTAGDAAALRVLARIPKTQQLDNNDITALTDAIKKAPTYEQLQKAITADATAAAAALNTAVGKLHHWQTVLTAESFNAIKSQYNYEKLTTKAGFEPEITRQKGEIQKHRNALATFTVADKKTHDELERLTRLNALAWLNPQTEAIARQDAIELFDQFEHLATICDSTCRGLEAQRQAYQILADSMPEDEEWNDLSWFRERGKVKDHRDEIKADLAKIEEALGRYQTLHRRLHGDPTHDDSSGKIHDKIEKKGILGVLSEAKELQPAKKTSTTSSSGYQHQDFADDAALNKKIKDEFEGKPTNGSASVTTVTGSLGVLSNAGELKPGEKRLHAKHAIEFTPTPTVTATRALTQKISACAYKEERGKLETKRSNTGQKATQPVTMTVIQYPKAGANTPIDSIRLKEEKVRFVTEMAANLLARMGTLPTKDNPIVLTGGDVEQVGMLWTALFELGKAHPDFKFDKDAIRVDAVCFDPGEQHGFFGYKSGSYYKDFFEGSSGAPLRTMCNSIRDFYNQGFGTEQQRETAKQTKADITSFYKKAIFDEKVKKGFMDVEKLALPSLIPSN